MGRERTVASGMLMMKIIRTTTMAKEKVIRSWSLWGRTGWSRFGRAAKKEERGGNSKTQAGRPVRDGGSSARPSITGPCGKTQSTTTMAMVAASRRTIIRRGRRRKGRGGQEERQRNSSDIRPGVHGRL